MTRTMVLYGRCIGAKAGLDDATLRVPWSDAVNFQEMASFMISGEYENAVIMPVNSSVGCGRSSLVRVTIDRGQTNFKGFTAHFWLAEKPYASEEIEGDLPEFDFDWVAYIPCSSYLT